MKELPFASPIPAFREKGDIVIIPKRNSSLGKLPQKRTSMKALRIPFILKLQIV